MVQQQQLIGTHHQRVTLQLSDTQFFGLTIIGQADGLLLQQLLALQSQVFQRERKYK
jgi:hypothetical protein